MKYKKYGYFIRPFISAIAIVKIIEDKWCKQEYR
jgi:hypothetical protein